MRIRRARQKIETRRSRLRRRCASSQACRAAHRLSGTPAGTTVTDTHHHISQLHMRAAPRSGALVALSPPLLLLLGMALPSAALSTTLDVDAALTVAEVTPYMGRGAGLEDANHEVTGGLWSQMVWGESFEEPPNADGVSSRGTDPSPGADLTWVAAPQRSLMTAGRHGRTENDRNSGCRWSVAAGDAQTGAQSQEIHGAGCGVLNRGPDAMGMAIEASREYSGFVFARLPDETQIQIDDAILRAGQTLDLEFALLRVAPNVTASTTLASTRVSVPANAMRAWTMVNFTLHTAADASAGCFEDARPTSPCDTDVAEKQCYSCSGAFSIILLSTNLTVRLDMAYLSPGKKTEFCQLVAYK